MMIYVFTLVMRKMQINDIENVLEQIEKFMIKLRKKKHLRSVKFNLNAIYIRNA